jgi:hypothetical protein
MIGLRLVPGTLMGGRAAIVARGRMVRNVDLQVTPVYIRNLYSHLESPGQQGGDNFRLFWLEGLVKTVTKFID